MYAEDTLESAYRKAQQAQRRGIVSIRVIIPAVGKRSMRRLIRNVWPGVPVSGQILHRIRDEDGVSAQFVVLVDPIDVLVAYRDAFARSVESTEPKVLRRQAPVSLRR